MPEALEDNSANGTTARSEFGSDLRALGEREFDAPGIVFGAFYGASPVVATEKGNVPADDPNHYVPHARPGARAPHVWVNDGVALYDLFGRDFTLLRLGAGRDTAALEEVARARSVPLNVCDCVSEEARDLYGADLVLVRPDQHVAWRGNAVPADPERLIARTVGFGDASQETTSGVRHDRAAS
jgi:hypothetical protein